MFNVASAVLKSGDFRQSARPFDLIRIERHITARLLDPTCWSRWFAGFLVALSIVVAGTAGASAETRSLKLKFIHTGETATMVFKRNGRYDQAGLKKLNQFLRDWRRNEPTRMDPRLFDLIWSVYKSVGGRDSIHVVSAYRSPKTNTMLRGRSKGVAEKSQHIMGRAMDFYIPGVSLKKLRETGMKMQVGGVGYYPRSGSPFVHMDVGNVRHWPKMSRRELVALFPKGNTLHVPSDGKPLPGFEQALASYQARKKSGATAIALASTGGSSSKKPTNLLAAFFGGGADDEEDIGEAAAAPSKPVKAAPAPEPEVVESPAATKPLIEIVPPEKANRAIVPLIEEPEQPAPEAIIAALPARAIPLPEIAPRPRAEVGPAPMATASIPEPTPTDIPFGMAQEAPAELASAAPVADAPAAAEIAATVPLPSWRPDTPTLTAAEDAPSEPDNALLMALASPDPEPLAEPVATSEMVAAVPTARPTAEDEEFPIAALPETAPAPNLAPVAELGAEDRAAVEADLKANSQRVAALATSVEAASPKLAIAARAPGTDPAAAIGVKTTRKSARASAADGKRAPKSVVVAAQPEAARWVLTKDYVAQVSKATKAPSFAYKVVVSAPREVYTAGFEKGQQVADANRFTGKAVKFLTVARFE